MSSAKDLASEDGDTLTIKARHPGARPAMTPAMRREYEQANAYRTPEQQVAQRYDGQRAGLWTGVALVVVSGIAAVSVLTGVALLVWNAIR